MKHYLGWARETHHSVTTRGVMGCCGMPYIRASPKSAAAQTHPDNHYTSDNSFHPFKCQLKIPRAQVTYWNGFFCHSKVVNEQWPILLEEPEQQHIFLKKLIYKSLLAHIFDFTKIPFTFEMQPCRLVTCVWLVVVKQEHGGCKQRLFFN